MKEIVILLVVAVIGFLLYNYYQTGEVTLFPKKLTPQERQIKELEKQLQQIEQSLASLERQARTGGMTAPQSIMKEQDRLKGKKAELEMKIKELQKSSE